MVLTPIVFTPPRRDPSLVQQAIVGTLTGLVRKKLIDDPRLRRQEEFFTSEREAGQEFTVEEREAKERAAKATARFANVTAPLELARKTEEFQEGLPIIPGLEGIRDAEIRAIQELDPDFQPSPPPETRRGQAGARAARGGILGFLLEQARVDVTANQTQQERADWMAGILDRFGTSLAQLPVFMVKDQDTGETRLPNDQETTLRRITPGIQAGAMADFENDERFVSLKKEADELESRVVPVPAYDPKVELEMLGEIVGATPGGENIRNLRAVASWLRSVGLVGGGGPGEDLWFTNDAGEEVPVSEAQFLVEFPAQAQSRIRGALWARVFFQNPDTFGAAKQAYGLRDAVAEDTYRKITGSMGPPVASSVSVAGPQRGEAGTPASNAKTLAERAEAFVSPGAQAMIEGDSTKVADLESYTEEFLADPAAYNERIDEIETLLSLPDDEFAKVLQEDGGLRGERRGGGSARFGLAEALPGGHIPERDALRLSWYSLFGVAQVEAQERRKTARQQ